MNREIYKNKEYRDWVNSRIYANVSIYIDYIIKKSYEDTNAPASYEDIEYFDRDGIIYDILVEFDNDKKGTCELAEIPITTTRDEFEIDLSDGYDNEELVSLAETLKIDTTKYSNPEVYEWWILDSWLAEKLKELGEVVINDNVWGRQGTGQAIYLDGIMQEVYKKYVLEVD